MVGALLAAGGAIMQGLFRNPLADPMLAGISPGAGLAAAAAIVIGDTAAGELIALLAVRSPARRRHLRVHS